LPALADFQFRFPSFLSSQGTVARRYGKIRLVGGAEQGQDIFYWREESHEEISNLKSRQSAAAGGLKRKGQ